MNGSLGVVSLITLHVVVISPAAVVAATNINLGNFIVVHSHTLFMR